MEKGFANVNKDELSPDDASWRAGINNLKSQQNSTIASGAGSDQGYTPAAGSVYGNNPNLDAGVGTNPGGGVVPNPTGDINIAKANLRNVIGEKLNLEQKFSSAQASVYDYSKTIASSVNTTLACYQGKVASLSGSTKTNAELVIATSTSRLAEINTISNVATSSLATSTINISTLESLSARVFSATTVEELQVIESDYNALVPLLFGWGPDTSDLAQDTIDKLEIYGDYAVQKSNECLSL
jgi:hypothetical protein